MCYRDDSAAAAANTRVSFTMPSCSSTPHVGYDRLGGNLLGASGPVANAVRIAFHVGQTLEGAPIAAHVSFCPFAASERVCCILLWQANLRRLGVQHCNHRLVSGSRFVGHIRAHGSLAMQLSKEHPYPRG